MRKIVLLPSVQNVQPGSTAIVNCPVGLTYDFFMFKLENVALADIEDIKVKINGKIVQEFDSGVELDDINKFHKRPASSDDVLTLWQMRPELISPVEQRLTSFGTMDVKTLSIEMKLASSVTNPKIDAYAQQSPGTPLGMITKVIPFPRTFSTAGKQEIDSIPKSGARIGCVHLFKSDVSEIEIVVNGRKAVEATKTVMEKIQECFGKVPISAKATHVDFTSNNMIGDALPTQGVQDLRIQPTIDSNGAIRTVVEYFDGFEGV